MLYALGPAHVANVNQAIDTWLDLDESPEAGKVTNLAIYAGANWILGWQHHPWILLCLLHAERDLLFVRINLEHHCLDCFTNGNNLGRMTDVACPAYFTDVYQTFDARL